MQMNRDPDVLADWLGGLGGHKQKLQVAINCPFAQLTSTNGAVQVWTYHVYYCILQVTRSIQYMYITLSDSVAWHGHVCQCMIALASHAVSRCASAEAYSADACSALCLPARACGPPTA
jgi:hypothetical protein